MPLELTPKQPPYYEIVTEASGIKQYIALLNQSGTNAPTATILKNTLNGTPIMGYLGAGLYTITLTGQFTVNKTTIQISNPNGGGNAWAYFYHADANEIQITTNILDLGSIVAADNYLDDSAIEITVYP